MHSAHSVFVYLCLTCWNQSFSLFFDGRMNLKLFAVPLKCSKMLVWFKPPPSLQKTLPNVKYLHFKTSDGVLLIAFNWMRKYFLSTNRNFLFVALHNHNFHILFLTHFHFIYFCEQFIITRIFCMLLAMFVCFFSFCFFFRNRSQFQVFTVTILY